jgi:hypothetical protein
MRSSIMCILFIPVNYDVWSEVRGKRDWKGGSKVGTDRKFLEKNFLNFKIYFLSLRIIFFIFTIFESLNKNYKIYGNLRIITCILHLEAELLT